MVYSLIGCREVYERETGDMFSICILRQILAPFLRERCENLLSQHTSVIFTVLRPLQIYGGTETQKYRCTGRPCGKASVAKIQHLIIELV